MGHWQCSSFTMPSTCRRMLRSLRYLPCVCKHDASSMCKVREKQAVGWSLLQ